VGGVYLANPLPFLLILILKRGNKREFILNKPVNKQLNCPSLTETFGVNFPFPCFVADFTQLSLVMFDYLLTIFLHTVLFSIPVIEIIILLFLWQKNSLKLKGFNRLIIIAFLFNFLAQSIALILYVLGFLVSKFSFHFTLNLSPFVIGFRFWVVVTIAIAIAVAIAVVIAIIAILPIVWFFEKYHLRYGFSYRIIAVIIYFFSWIYIGLIPNPYSLAFTDNIKFRLSRPEVNHWMNEINCTPISQILYIKNQPKYLPKDIQEMRSRRIDIICNNKNKQISFIYNSPDSRQWALSIIMPSKPDISFREIRSVKNLSFEEWSRLHIDYDALQSWVDKQACKSEEKIDFSGEEIDKLNLPETIREPQPSRVSLSCSGTTVLNIWYGGGLFEPWGLEISSPRSVEGMRVN
jgi:hypothetical protein